MSNVPIRSTLNRYLLSMVLLLAILYVGRILFIPMSYGLFIAIVMYPICKWLEHKRWSRSLAVTASLGIVIILFAMLIWLLVVEIRVFQQELPDLKEKAAPSFQMLQTWLQEKFGWSLESQDQWWQEQKETTGVASLVNPGVLRSLSNSLFILFIIPVFAALFLYNRGVFVRFLRLLLGNVVGKELDPILHETVHTYFNYIKGMVLVYLIVGSLNSLGLLALGVRHAILFGFLTAIMTMIPYIGIVVSALLPISVSWIDTGSLWIPLGVVAVFAFVQYLEANVIFPKVVGAQLNVSTWAMLVFIIAGGLVWGVSGMVLFIPFAGILKIVTDHHEGLEAWNVLLSR